MKIVKLDRWAVLLQEYDINSSKQKPKTISWQTQFQDFTLSIYMETPQKLQHPPIAQNKVKSSKVTESMQQLDTGTAQQLLNITTKTLRSLQKQDRFCRRKVHELQTDVEWDKILPFVCFCFKTTPTADDL